MATTIKVFQHVPLDERAYAWPAAEDSEYYGVKYGKAGYVGIIHRRDLAPALFTDWLPVASAPSASEAI